MQFQTLKMAPISRGQGHFSLDLHTSCPLPLAMSLQSCVGITKIDLEQSAKKWFQTLKMATISRGQGPLRSNSRTRCPLPLAMSLPSSVGMTKIDWEKSAKKWFQTLKNGHHFLKSRLFDVKFADKVPLTPSDVPTKFCFNNQNIFGEEVQKCNFRP